MERLKVTLTYSDIKKLARDLKKPAPDGCLNKRGFEQMSPDGEYFLTMWMDADGTVEIEARPAPSYANLENLDYSAVGYALDIEDGVSSA